MRTSIILIFLFELISIEGFSQRYNVTELTSSGFQYYLNGSPYNGKAYVLTTAGQLKEEYEVENGMMDGIYEIYKIDDHFDKSKYIDTLLIAKKIKIIQESKSEILSLQKDSIRKLDSIWIHEEELFGGRIFKQLESIEVLKRKEKQKTLSEKYTDDKLNKKKEGLYNKYADAHKSFVDCVETLAAARFRLKAHNEWLVKEKNKPSYKNVLTEKFTYVRGVDSGIHTVYNKNGEVEIEETLDNRKKNGPYKRYSGSKIVEEGNYVNNEKDGEWTTFNSSEKITQNYSKGKFNGEYKRYDGDDLLESGQYVQGLKNGEWKKFDHFGRLAVLNNFKLDKLDGPFKKYSGGPNVLTESGQYVEGLKNGEWKNFDYYGKLILLQNFQFDKLSGVSKEYSSLTSDIIFEINYNENIVSGIQKGYYSDKSVAFNSIMNSTELNSAKKALRLIYTGEEVKLSKLDSTAKCYLQANELFKLNDFDLRAKTIGDDLYAKYKNDFWGLIARLYEIYLIENDDNIVKEKYKDVLAINEAFYDDWSSDIDKLSNDLKAEIAKSKPKENTVNNGTSDDNLKTYQCKGYISKYEYNSSGKLQIQVSSVKCGACGTTLNYGNGWFTFEGKKDDCNQKEYVCKGGIGYNGCGVKNILLPCKLKVYSKGENF